MIAHNQLASSTSDRVKKTCCPVSIGTSAVTLDDVMETAAEVLVGAMEGTLIVIQVSYRTVQCSNDQRDKRRLEVEQSCF